MIRKTGTALGAVVLFLTAVGHSAATLEKDTQEPKDSFNEAARKELRSFQGEWILLTIEENGMKHELGGAERMILKIKDAKWSFAGTQEQGEIAALDTSTNPKLIDWKAIPRNADRARVREGIYKLDGDTLTLCIYKGEDKKRPTSFEAPKEANTSLMTLKRAKP